MRTVFQWMKNHKILVLLILVIAHLLFKDNTRISPKIGSFFSKQYTNSETSSGALGFGEVASSFPPSQSDYAPTPEVKNRMVVQNSYLSLLVDDVPAIQNTIIQKAQELDGYMVNTSLSRPQDSPNATITIRVPATSFNATLSFLRGLGVKVISENVEGYDVTDQYVDIDARLSTLEKTKLKFEAIMDQAVKVPDILEVQRELINLQSQVDNLKGQQNYIEKNSAMAKITIYLSTDELALPYAPSESWRPQVIFKEAVRSLISFFRKVGTTVIWIGVYAIIWIPVGLIIFIWYKRKKKNNPRTQLN